MAKAKAKAKAPKETTVAYIVGWSLREATGRYEDLEAVAEGLGLGQYLPAPPSYEARLRRALAKVKRAHGVAFRRMPSSPKASGSVVYRLDQGLATWKGVVLQRNLGGLRMEDPDSPLLQEVVEAYEATAGLYFHETINGWLHRVLERDFHAAPFPATGGAHVVPAGEETGHQLEALQAAAQAIGSSTLDFEALPGQTALARNAAHGLLGAQWSTMVEELEGFLAGLLAGDLTHPTGYTAKLAQAEALHHRLDLYSRVLGPDRDGMAQGLEALEAATRTLLSATTEARALRKAKGSETASRLASQAVEAATTEAQTHLATARGQWPPAQARAEELR